MLEKNITFEVVSSEELVFIHSSSYPWIYAMVGRIGTD